MGLMLKFPIWIICLTEVVFLEKVLDRRLEIEVFSLNSSRDYRWGRECGGVGIRCSVHQSDKILSDTCIFR